MTTEQFARLQLAHIEPSLTNPRKSFDAAKLQELAESIKASGVHQPVLVRPLPGTRLADTHLDPATGKKRTVLPTHELVAGERRYRASKLAGVADIPAMIRELTDDQVIEIQMIENLQRDDLSELEEAVGFRMMMDRLSINAEAVGAKIGKSRAYVYTRTKLLDLSVETKQALREGKIDASRALYIARIPDTKLQLKALEYATKGDWQGELPSVRDFQRWLRENVMLKLEHAVFKITDARLVTEAGSCSDCPKRTGANPDLFVEVDSADICTDPACFHNKEEAHRSQLRKRAEAKGMRVVEGKEALELMDGLQYRNLPEGYEDLSTKRPDLGQAGDNVQTLGELLGKEAPEAILFVHPRTQAMVELVPTEKAKAVLLAKGLQANLDDDDDEDDGDHEAVLERLQKQAAESTSRHVHRALYEATVNRVRGLDDTAALELLTTGDLLRAILLTKLGGYMDAEGLAHALGYTFVEGEDEEDGVAMHIRATSTANLCKAVVLCELGEDSHYSSHCDALILPALVKELDLDTAAMTKQASAAVKAEFADRLKFVKAKIAAKNAQKAPAPTAPLAQPEHAGGDKAKGAKAPAKKAPAARAKLSAQEAISGIAAAMQSVDRAAAAPGGAVAPPEATKGETQESTDAEILAANRQLLGIGLAIGQKVTALFGKCKGKEGEVIKDLGDDCYQVKHKGRSVPMSYRQDQLEVLEGAVA
jgi:ParB/RepB/Spo0J family partition protein